MYGYEYSTAAHVRRVDQTSERNTCFSESGSGEAFVTVPALTVLALPLLALLRLCVQIMAEELRSPENSGRTATKLTVGRPFLVEVVMVATIK